MNHYVSITCPCLGANYKLIAFPYSKCQFNSVIPWTRTKVPEYSPSLDEEGVCRAAFDLTSAFDEAISLGNKENVTVAQVKQYCEMESHEEKAHKLMMQTKINETKDLMKKRANELDKMKVWLFFTRFKIHQNSV